MDIPTYSGRGPNVPRSVDNIIAEVYVQDRQQTAKEVMDEAHKRLKEKDMQRRPGWPGLSYIQKVLTEYRQPDSELSPDPEDRPWSRVYLADYPIPPETLPVVLKVWAHALRKDKNKPLTIREAQWVARLYYIFLEWQQRGKNSPASFLSLETPPDSPPAYLPVEEDELIDRLLTFAKTSSYQEKVLKLQIEQEGYPNTKEDLYWYWLEDALLHGLIVKETQDSDNILHYLK